MQAKRSWSRRKSSGVSVAAEDAVETEQTKVESSSKRALLALEPELDEQERESQVSSAERGKREVCGRRAR